MRVYSLGPAGAPPGAPAGGCGVVKTWVALAGGALGPPMGGKFAAAGGIEGGGAGVKEGNVALGGGALKPLGGGGPPGEPPVPNIWVNWPGLSFGLVGGSPALGLGRPPPPNGEGSGSLGAAGGGAEEGEAENMRVNSPGPCCGAAPGPLAGLAGRASGGGNGVGAAAGVDENIWVKVPGADGAGGWAAGGWAGGASYAGGAEGAAGGAGGVENIRVNSPGGAAGALDMEVPGLSRDGTWNSFMKSSSRLPAPAGGLAEPDGSAMMAFGLNIRVNSPAAGAVGITSEAEAFTPAGARKGGSVSPRSRAP